MWSVFSIIVSVERFSIQSFYILPNQWLGESINTWTMFSSEQKSWREVELYHSTNRATTENIEESRNSNEICMDLSSPQFFRTGESVVKTSNCETLVPLVFGFNFSPPVHVSLLSFHSKREKSSSFEAIFFCIHRLWTDCHLFLADCAYCLCVLFISDFRICLFFIVLYFTSHERYF